MQERRGQEAPAIHSQELPNEHSFIGNDTCNQCEPLLFRALAIRAETEQLPGGGGTAILCPLGMAPTYSPISLTVTLKALSLSLTENLMTKGEKGHRCPAPDTETERDRAS